MNYVEDVGVGKAVPDAVASDDDILVFWLDAIRYQLRLVRDKRLQADIADRPAGRQNTVHSLVFCDVAA